MAWTEDGTTSLPPGTVIDGETGQYTVVGPRERGGTAQVFEVRDANGAPRALKVLSAHRFPITVEMRRRFEREVRHLLAVDSETVLRAVDRVRLPQGATGLVTEWHPRGSLYDYLSGRGGRLSVPEALGILRDVLSGLCVLHDYGLVHRDLSPRNILLRDNGRALVADFGTVRHLFDETVTDAEAVIGSLIYISEAQFNDVHVAAPVDDVFSIGQIGWELLAGRRPVGNPPALDSLRGDLHPELVKLIESMRSANPEERPQTACWALEALDAHLDRRWPRLDGGWHPRVQDRAVLEHLERRQYDACERIRDAEMGQVAWALEDLIGLLGPFSVALDVDPAAAVEDLPLAIDSELRRRLELGSLEFRVQDMSWDGGVAWVLDVRNRMTGATCHSASGTVSTPRMISLEEIAAKLAQLDFSSALTRELLLPFSESAMTVGPPCADCGEALQLRTEADDLREGRRFLARSASCPNDDPSEPFRCVRCGSQFKPYGGARDEWGEYDVVGCACGPAIDLHYLERPWRGTRPLTPEDVRPVLAELENHAIR